MSRLASLSIAASAGIILFLGLAHLRLTFSGNALHPRDDALRLRLAEVSPVITRETTMWKAWIGFNASHGYGAILFGLVYGYLALAHGAFLSGSPFLLCVGLALLLGYVALGRAYWFSVPLRGILAATALYVLGLVALWF